MTEACFEAAKALMDEAMSSPKPKLPREEREAFEKEVGGMERRYLSKSELQVLVRFSYRQLLRLKKGHLMPHDRGLLEALMLLKKAHHE